MEIKTSYSRGQSCLHIGAIITDQDLWQYCMSEVMRLMVERIADQLLKELGPTLKEEFLREYTSAEFRKKIQDEVTLRLFNQMLR